MRLQLYINGSEVEFTSEPEINYNWTQEELKNPTIVKNSFSKTISLPSTKANNKVFSNICDLQQIYSASNGYFNPAVKTDFQIYDDGILIESGYAKLDEIKRKGNKWTYEITLYGGLGDFFYSLSYNEDGSQKKLSDLHYTEGDSATELDYIIDRNVVKEAWGRLENGTGNSKYDVINFAPAYNGLPENLTSNKMLVNQIGTTFPSAITEEGTTYSLYNGYGMVGLANEMTEWEVGDLRSWLQRPVLRMKSVINACMDTQVNGGWTVNLDDEFFNSNNPYYDKAWLTLPQLNSLEFTASEQEEGVLSFGTPIFSSGNTYYRWDYPVAVAGPVESYNDPSITFNMELSGLTTAYSNLYLQGYLMPQAGLFSQGNIMAQLVAYDESSNVIGASDVLMYGLANISLTKYVESGIYVPEGSRVSPRYVDGAFRLEGNKYKWYDNNNNSSYSLSLGEETNYHHLRLIITKVGMTYFTLNSQTLTPHPTIEMTPFSGNFVSSLFNWTHLSQTATVVYTQSSNFRENLISSYVKYSRGTSIGSGATIKKSKLLDTENTPADYLINYCKLFGLYFETIPYSKTINIRLRKNYYTGKINDISGDIDYGSDSSIVPLSFDSKWYDFKYGMDDESYFMKVYKDGNSIDYGQQRVNTNYQFNSEAKDLLEGTTYQEAIEGTERSKYYRTIYADSAMTTTVPTFEIDGWDYTLWGPNQSGTTVSYGSQSTNYATYFSSDEGYDIFPKVQYRDSDNKPTEGKNTLVFFNGFKNLKNADGDNIPFWLTDDLNEMGVLNEGNSCWLYTERETDINGVNIAHRLMKVPAFGRYIMSGNTITKSWDFGEPAELYIPRSETTSASTLYNQYWRNYISDLYNLNTRVATLEIRPRTMMNGQWLRDFYWFNNSLWVINRIIDYNPTAKGTTQVEFIKVKDATNYTPNVPSTNYLYVRPAVIEGSGTTNVITNLNWNVVGEDTPELSAILSQNQFTSSGGSATLQITTTHNWTITRTSDFVTLSAYSGSGNDTLSVYVANNGTSEVRTSTITVRSTNGLYSVNLSITQSAGQEVPYITPQYSTYTIPSGSGGQVMSMTVDSNVNWSVRSTKSWLTVERVNERVDFSATTAYDEREAEIEYMYNGTTYSTTTITQESD